MRRYLCLAALSVAATLWLTSAGTTGEKGKSDSCGAYGTTVEFEKSPSDAAKRALKEEKLVMVLHVSGDFENPDFT